ncbi:hypothetical protein LshimejAT787_0308320 [Lyophyllum shimeji]|uniref:Uncharacterized protein n=1 Tax=Lyophyllum shimeji TaxID=47721 RepID=A0A9P3PJE6_LYOSH|nr:hypothetical protein LshimejAT787_0308320 [Lyophyllum shimeji]
MSSIHGTAEMDDGSSLALTIDEIRWLHASEAIMDSPIQEKATRINAAPSTHDDCDGVFDSSADTSLTRSDSGVSISTPSMPIFTPPPVQEAASKVPLPTPVEVKHSASLSTRSRAPPSSFSYKPLAPTLTLATSLPTPPYSRTLRTNSPTLHRNRKWDNRHYHLGRGTADEGDTSLPSISSSSLDLSMRLPSASSSSSPSTPTRSSPKASLIPIPIPNTTATPIRTRSSPRTPTTPTQLSRSLPNPSPHRTEWIYRHPKRRSPPALSLTTSTSSTTTLTPKLPSPKSASPKSNSPTTASRLPVPVRARTRSTTARTSPIAKPRPRPQTGYHAHALSHANTSGNVAKKPAQVHSTIPARPGFGKSVSPKGKEKVKEGKDKQKLVPPLWGLLRARRGEEEKDDDEKESCPGSRILDIVNSSVSSSSVFDDDSEDEGDKKSKGKGKLKIKTDNTKGKGKGIALVLGKGRPSVVRPPAHKRSASVSSTLSSTSAAPSTAGTISSSSTAVPAFALPPAAPATSVTTATPEDPSTPARNRASSSSSNSSNSTASSGAHSTSTAATSPSPSLASSPKPLPGTPAKSILTRSASSSSRAPPSSLAALFSISRGNHSASGSAKSVTFVDEPTVHYPYAGEYGDDAHAEGEGVREGEEYVYDEAQYGSGDEDEVPHSASERTGRDMVDVGEGVVLSKAALAWEMGVDVETMDMSFDSSKPSSAVSGSGVNLDAELQLDMGQMYVPPERIRIAGVIAEEQEDEEEEDGGAEEEERRGREATKVKKGKGREGGLKRLFSLTRSGGSDSRTNSKSSDKSNTSPARPTISGPFALGSLPPPALSASFSSRSLSPSQLHLHSAAGRSTTSIRSQTRSHLSCPRSDSNSTSHRMHTRSRYPHYTPSASTPSTPTHHKSHSYSHPPSVRPTPHVHATHHTRKGSPVLPDRDTASARGPYASSLRPAPSFESFRSITGRSVRSLGSVRSTASTRGFRAWLARVGEGIGISVGTGEGQGED